jgi:hypothetical protein
MPAARRWCRYAELGSVWLLKEELAGDSPLEEAGFELSVLRDTAKVSRPPHVASA